MSKYETFKKLFRKDKRGLFIAVYNNIVHTHVTDILSDETFLKLTYLIRFGEFLNLNEPLTFNQKLQWLKLNDQQERYILLVDKILVKEYVANIIGNEYIIPTLGIWDKFDEIDFNQLPEQFVLKCNHDSGSVVICKDKKKFDIRKARNFLTKKLNNDAFYWGREWPYRFVNRKILAEPYLTDESGIELKDYKFMCFNGKVRCSFVCSERFTSDELKVTFFDRDWNRMPFIRHYPSSSVEISKPYNYENMIILSEKLSQDLPFVRVDFYESSGKIYFSELTFYPGSGFEEFIPPEWDKVLGSWIDLSKVRL